MKVDGKIKGLAPLPSTSCPVFQAIHRRGLKNFSVGTDELVFRLGRTAKTRRWHTYLLPNRIGSWIEAYDSGIHVKPISFTAIVPA